MTAFPTLSGTNIPLQQGYSERYSEAGDLLSPTDAGYKISRRQFTRRPKIYSMGYAPLTSSDKSTMESFIYTNGLSGSFTWTEPVSGSSKTVRISKLPQFSPMGGGLWLMSGLELEEL